MTATPAEKIHTPKILVLGAGGLIGSFIAVDLKSRGFSVIAVARKFTSAQRDVLEASAREFSVGEADTDALTQLIHAAGADVVVNCLGALQAAPGEADIHDDFVARLIDGIRLAGRTPLLVHVSIPGDAASDSTAFAITKRKADRRIAESGLPYVILRPGFVWAPAAYGGSALMRALAASPFDPPAFERGRPFMGVAVEDIAETVARLASRLDGSNTSAAVWDVMHPDPLTVGDVIDSLRGWMGTRGGRTIAIPSFLLDVAAKAGDLIALLGWRPAVRSTAVAEMRRGVAGDPARWMAGTGITPRSLDEALRLRPATVQECWFAGLYLLKPVIIAVLVVFWCVSGGIVLAFSFRPAAELLLTHGFSREMANVVTIISSLMDIGVGLAIAVRRTSYSGLMAGVAVSLFYMASAAFLTPDLWIEPLGALVKTGPAIVLMLVALAIFDSR